MVGKKKKVLKKGLWDGNCQTLLIRSLPISAPSWKCRFISILVKITKELAIYLDRQTNVQLSEIRSVFISFTLDRIYFKIINHILLSWTNTHYPFNCIWNTRIEKRPTTLSETACLNIINVKTNVIIKQFAFYNCNIQKSNLKIQKCCLTRRRH